MTSSFSPMERDKAGYSSRSASNAFLLSSATLSKRKVLRDFVAPWAVVLTYRSELPVEGF